jgi:hypothetical protein
MILFKHMLSSEINKPRLLEFNEVSHVDFVKLISSCTVRNVSRNTKCQAQLIQGLLHHAVDTVVNANTIGKPALAAASRKENRSGANAVSKHVQKTRRLSIVDYAVIFHATISCPRMI